MARKKSCNKWSNVPDAPVEMSDRFKAVLEEADKLRWHPVDEPSDVREPFTMTDLQNEWVALEEEEAFAELAAAQRSIKFDALERRILEELEIVKRVSGSDMWRGDHKTFSPKFTPRPQVKDLHALMQWIESTGQRDQLTLPAPRLKAIVCEALDTELAASMTPAQRAALKPGDPASGVPPPGVEAYLDRGINHRTVRITHAGDDDGPF